LFGDLDTATPYDIVHNLRRGADLAEVYGGLQAQVEGGLGAHTRYAALARASVLRWMRGWYADGIGPWKGNLPGAVPEPQRRPQRDGKAASSHRMLADALDAGLLVHPYTLRAEPAFLAHAADGAPWSVIDEAVQLFGLGVQGIFIDQPDQGVAARNIFLGRNPAVAN
jgi:glycerophosphoryl diester phosphodiesterase